MTTRGKPGDGAGGVGRGPVDEEGEAKVEEGDTEEEGSGAGLAGSS